MVKKARHISKTTKASFMKFKPIVDKKFMDIMVYRTGFYFYKKCV